MIPRTEQRSIEERAELRHSAVSNTAVLEFRGRKHVVRLINISERGFMAASDGRFEVGSRVWLMLPGRERANAVVKWIAGDKIGAEFAEPIALDDVKNLTGSR